MCGAKRHQSLQSPPGVVECIMTFSFGGGGGGGGGGGSKLYLWVWHLVSPHGHAESSWFEAAL